MPIASKFLTIQDLSQVQRYPKRKKMINYPNKEKSALNKLIFDWAEKLELSFGYALLLDTEEFNSTRVLARLFFSQILIPEIDEATFNKMIKNGSFDESLKKIRVVCSLLNNVIQTLEAGEISLAYFDYCGTLNGNKKKKIFPKDDISLSFERKIFGPMSMIVLTFSQRQRGSGGGLLYKEVKDFVANCANKNGYQVILKAVKWFSTKTSEGTKGTPMILFIFQVLASPQKKEILKLNLNVSDEELRSIFLESKVGIHEVDCVLPTLKKFLMGELISNKLRSRARDALINCLQSNL